MKKASFALVLTALAASFATSRSAPEAELASTSASPDSTPVADHHPRLQWVGRYDSGYGSGTEIVSVQARTQRAVLSSSDRGSVDVLDLSIPAQPVLAARHRLSLNRREELTSVAFHPRLDYYAAAIQGNGSHRPGRVELRSASDGRLLGVIPTGIGPDAVTIDPTGSFALCSNEGEPFDYDASNQTFTSPPGSLTLIELAADPSLSTAIHLPLSDATDVDGFSRRGDGRLLERDVDWDGNGKIDERVDFNGDGQISDVEVPIGTVGGVRVMAKETDGETLLLPLANATPMFLEPEVAAFTADGRRAFVTLQENNGLVELDVERGKLVRYIGLGMTRHTADRQDDERVAFADPLLALREPDGLAITPDGRFLVTADEGDTDPKTSKTKRGFPAGGGRTVTVVALESGRVIGDTGNQIDAAAHAAGIYPDGRSDAKGAEPEMIAALDFGGTTYAVVGLERAGGLALVSLEDPANPQVIHVAACPRRDPTATPAPEGLAHFRDRTTGEHYVVIADEGTGLLEVFSLRRR